MTPEYRWFQNYLKLAKIYKDYGDANIPFTYITTDGVQLGVWLNRQRKAYFNGTLSKERISFLNGLKITWDTSDIKWDKMYAMVEKYYKINGHSNIPTRSLANDKNLGIWINNQRKAYKHTLNLKITPERIKKLNQLEFEWSKRDTFFLNQEITDKNKYKKVMLERMRHILEDLSYEIDGEITDIYKQKSIEEEIIKRMWR